MTSMKRLGLAALCAIGVALFMSSLALAEDWGTITLTNPTDAKDRDYGASGWATLTDVTYSYTHIEGEFPYQYAYDVYTGYLTLRCEGLTPGAAYGVGPIAPSSTVILFNGKVLHFDYYSYVTASDTGTVELAVQVTFFSGCSYQWVEIDGGPWWDDYGYWELIGCSYGYPLEVFRSQGRRNNTPVLGGYFRP